MITKLVSGGQTGADIAALDVALLHSFPHGGWCPKGRKSLEGPIPARYRLTETPSASYLQRTEWNVRDSDGTVVFTLAREVTGGSLRTIGFARKHDKPCLHLSQGVPDAAVLLVRFVESHGINTLNVAGSRESKEPGIHEWVSGVLSAAFFRGEGLRDRRAGSRSSGRQRLRATAFPHTSQRGAFAADGRRSCFHSAKTS